MINILLGKFSISKNTADHETLGGMRGKPQHSRTTGLPHPGYNLFPLYSSAMSELQMKLQQNLYQ